MPGSLFDINNLTRQFNNLLKLPGAADPKQVQKDIAAEEVAQAQSKLGLTQDNAKGYVYSNAAAYAENKGLAGQDYDKFLKQQLEIIDYTQAKAGSFRLSVAEKVPILAPLSTIGGVAALAARALPFAEAIAGGGGLAAGFAAMGPIGYIGAGLFALGYVLPQAFNISNDYTAMQPTMLAGLLLKLQEDQDKAEPVGATNYGNFTEDDFTNYYNVFIKAGIGAYDDPFNARSSLTSISNIKDTVRGIIAEFGRQNITPTKVQVQTVLYYLVLNSVQASTRKEAGAETIISAAGEAAPAAVTRVTASKTAKPKLFTGIVMTGRVGEYKDFVRKLDDKITDDQDLKNDIKINLTNWLAALAGKLNYTLAIKSNPLDDLGITKPGTWCTLSMNISNQYGKNLFVDEILLGPIDPLVYYPEFSRFESIQKEIRGEVSAAAITMPTLPGEPVTAITPLGERIEITAPAPAPVAPAPAPVAPAAPVYVPPVTPQGVPVPVPTVIPGEVAGGVAAPVAQGIPTYEEWLQKEYWSTGLNSSQLNMESVKRRYLGLYYPRTVKVGVDVLNVRSEPYTSAPLAGTQKLYRGDQFVVTNWVEGDIVGSEKRWWVSQFGNYVWAGGTNEKP